MALKHSDSQAHKEAKHIVDAVLSIHHPETGIELIWLNRPDRRNALGLEMADELTKALISADRNPAVRAVVLAGKGSHFCAGGDLKEWSADRTRPLPERIELMRRLQQPVIALFGLSKPTVAAVNGGAVGAGMSLVLTADLVIAEDDARFQQVFVKAGVLPDLGSLYWLPRLVGVARARSLMLADQPVDARQAVEWGLIHKVVETGQVVPMAIRLAAQLAQGPAGALAQTKSMLRRSYLSDFEAFLKVEAEMQATHLGSAEASEGIAAFMTKRKPHFTAPTEGSDVSQY